VARRNRGSEKNGETYWALETITPLRDARGEITHYLAIQQDITEQKRDKEALVESEARFRQVAEMTGGMAMGARFLGALHIQQRSGARHSRL